MNRGGFASSLPILMPQITFSYLIALATKSSTMVNSSRDSEYFCLAPDLSGNVSSVSPFYIYENVALNLYSFSVSIMNVY